MTILASLLDLHDEMAAAGEMPPPGFAEQAISGEVMIDLEGKLVGINSLTAQDGKAILRRRMQVPAVLASRASGIAAQFMWDKTSYVLGVEARTTASKKLILTEDGAKIPAITDRSRKEFDAFVEGMEMRLDDTEDPGLKAVLVFLRNWRPEMFAEQGHDVSLLDENLVFRISGEDAFLHQRPEIAGILALAEDAGEDPWTCLVTGEPTMPARTHPHIKGVKDAQPTGAALVSFNADSFTSYGKEQGLNAPISPRASKAISNVANHLLRQTEPGAGRRSVMLGDMTLIFWASCPEGVDRTGIEDMASWMINGPMSGEDDLEDVQARLGRQMSTLHAGETDDRLHGARIHVLGILGNKGRLSVKYWSDRSLPDFLAGFQTFQDELEIISGPPRISNTIWALTRETAPVEGKTKDKENRAKVKPNLPEALLRTILDGGKIPLVLVQSILTRIRVERRINARRAAICKAYLSRNEKEPVTVSLDPENTSPAYLLGRAMRLHEEIQKKANPNLNRTVADRYMAAAMATPARVFAAMNRGTKHSLAKIRREDGAGLAEYFEGRLAAVLDAIEGDIPVRLGTADQARFTLGYYHQKCHRHAADAEQSNQTEGTPT